MYVVIYQVCRLHIQSVCTCGFSIIVAHPCWIMQVDRGNWSLSPWAVFMAARVKVFSNTKRGALNFKWDSREGLKRRRSKSVEGFSPLSTPHPPPSLPLSLSPCQPFQKASIFSHQAVGACCHVAMLPECQAEYQSYNRVWMYNKDGASSDQRPCWRKTNVHARKKSCSN